MSQKKSLRHLHHFLSRQEEQGVAILETFGNHFCAMKALFKIVYSLIFYERYSWTL